MLGLGAYETSSEDEDSISRPATNLKKIQSHPSKPVDSKHSRNESLAAPSAEDVSGPLVGPFQPAEPSYPLEDASIVSRKSSPFASQRSLIRDMTLPPHPNLDIPPSPPGSPSPSSNQRFAHFLSLKKQGIHFNGKLATSSSLKNPSLLSSLRQHAGLENTSQYATSLGTNIWDVTNLPQWGYKEELQKSQQELRRRIEEKKGSTPRDNIEFVQGSQDINRHDSVAPKVLKSSVAERVMAGLNREGPGIPSQSRWGEQDRSRYRTR